MAFAEISICSLIKNNWSLSFPHSELILTLLSCFYNYEDYICQTDIRTLHFSTFSGQIKHHHQRHGYNTYQRCHYIDGAGIDRILVVELRQLNNRCCRRCNHRHQTDQKNCFSIFYQRLPMADISKADSMISGVTTIFRIVIR